MKDVNIKIEDINSVDAYSLITELSSELKNSTGNDGTSSFSNEDMINKRSIFVIARDKEGIAIGCGALRCYSSDIAEIKRMYVREKSLGVGSKLLGFLEEEAKGLGYKKIILETRVINKNAVNFYYKNKYVKRNNYGKYIGKKEAICFEKCISSK